MAVIQVSHQQRGQRGIKRLGVRISYDGRQVCVIQHRILEGTDAVLILQAVISVQQEHQFLIVETHAIIV